MVEPGLEAAVTAHSAAAPTRESSPANAEQSGATHQSPAPRPVATAASPPARPAKYRQAPGPRNPWGVAARCFGLAALLGMALVYFAQFSVNADWVTIFLLKNELEMPRRMMLIVSGIGGAGLAIVITVLLLSRAHRRGIPFTVLERRLWIASPLIVLPAVPLVFDARAWMGHHQTLLTVLMPVLLMIEVLVARAWIALPESVGQLWSRIAYRVPELWRKRTPDTIVSAAAVAYILFMSVHLVRWYHEVQTHDLELALDNNVMYGALKGAFMQSTVTNGVAPTVYRAAHANWGAYVLLPIYAIVPRPETLLVLGSFLLGLGALPLYGFARHYVSPWPSALIGLAYLAYYPLHTANFADSVFLEFGVFFVLVTVWAAASERWRWLWIAFACGVLMTEDMPIGFATIGAVLLLTGYRPKTGLTMTVISLVWLFLLHAVIMPRAGDSALSDAYRVYLPAGERGVSSVIGTLATNPLFVLDRLIAKEKVFYLLHLLVPLAFLPVRRWWLWAAGIPGIVLTLLVTDNETTTSFTHQYVLHWIPYLFLAVPLALASIKSQGDHGMARMRAALCTFAFASVVTSFNYGAFARRGETFKGAFNSVSFTYTARDAARYSDVRQLIALIPRDASVSATETLVPHVSSRLKIYSFKSGTFQAAYLLVARDDVSLGDTRKFLEAAVKNNEYGVRRRIGAYALLERGYAPTDNAAFMKAWKL